MIPAIVLAAGRSSRMEALKALLPLSASPEDLFVTRCVESLRRTAVDDVLVVMGYEGQRIRAVLERCQPPVRLTLNDNWEAGQLSSIVCGLDVVDRPGVEAMLVLPVDVPLVRPDTIQTLLDTYRHSRPAIVRPVYGERHGHPVIFDRVVFDELRHADPQRGAKAIIHDRPERVVNVPVDDEGSVIDIDTPEEYYSRTGLRIDQR